MKKSIALLLICLLCLTLFAACTPTLKDGKWTAKPYLQPNLISSVRYNQGLEIEGDTAKISFSNGSTVVCKISYDKDYTLKFDDSQKSKDYWFSYIKGTDVAATVTKLSRQKGAYILTVDDTFAYAIVKTGNTMYLLECSEQGHVGIVYIVE